MTLRRWLLFTIATLWGAAILLAFAANSAHAAFKRPLSATLTTTAPALNFPLGVAVDNDPASPAKGEVYVADDGNHRIAKFKGNGTPDGQIDSANVSGVCPGQTVFGISEPPFVATDPTNGDLYVVDISSGGTLTAFDPTGNCIFQTNASNGMPGGAVALGVAVDPNAGPNGTVYVSNRAPSPAIDEFDAETGAFTGSFPVTQNNALVGLAVDPAGNVYLADHNEPPNGLIKEYEPATGVLLRNFDTNTAQSVAVDPGNGHIFVGEHGETPQYQIAEFNSDTETSPQVIFGSEDFPSGGGGYGLAVNTLTNTIYASDTNANSIHVYGPGAIVPNVLTGEGLGISHKITVLTGHVDPAGGGPIEECQFEYVEAADYAPGTPNPYGAGPPPVPCEQATPINAEEEVSAKIEGLKGETTYDFRLVASNANGANQGGNRTFVSAPAVLNVKVVPPVTDLDRTSATLNGSLNPDGIETHYHFEYGTTECSFGGCTSLPELGPLSDKPGAAGDSVSQQVSGLQTATTYSYRLVAQNELGVTSSEEGTFTTLKAVFGLSTDPATNVGLTTATLNGSLNPAGLETHYYFKYGVDENYGQKTVIEDAGSADTTPNPSAPVKGVEVSGLQPHHSYHFRIVAENTFGISEGPDRTFSTPSTPTVGSFTTTNVTAHSADLHATINPQGFETKYRFEYGTSASYGTSAPAVDEAIGSATTDQSVSVHLEDLQTSTYHFRVVATNEWGTTVSGDQTFNFYPPLCPNAHVRQETGSSNLPDCRAYELVSPPNQGNVVVFPGSAPAAPYATDPARFAWGGGFGQVTGTNPPSNIQVDDYISTRTDSGWVTTFAGLKGNEVQGQGYTTGDLGFDKIIDFESGGCLGCDTEPESLAPFVWDVNGNSLGRWPESMETLSTEDTSTHGSWQPSPDFSHLAFSSNNFAFGPGSSGLTTAPGSAYDYNTTAGTSTIISKTPSGSNIPQEPGNTNAAEFIRFPGDNFISYNDMAVPTQLHPSVSTDGTHILMSTAGATGGVHLYMRVNDAVTYDVSAGHDVNYVGMTADGSKVFFTSDQQLTADDADTSTDLYMWSLSAGGDSITRVSAGNNGAGNSNSCSASGGWTGGCSVVMVQPIYASSSGDSPIAAGNGDIYFYSPEQLDGSRGLPNQENLYVYRGGQIQYVTTFAPGQYCVEEYGCSNGPVGRFDVSPDDSHMAFITNQQMTGYENYGFAEMYSYQPAGGGLLCVSCNPSGEPPVGNTEGSDNGLFMSNDGRTFFYTRNALVAQDTDKVRDVYEYVDGRPQLITAGTGSTDSGSRGADFAGVSADGVNVYFSTFDVLINQDHNGQFAKYYDARTNGGFPAGPAPAPCAAADECHGAGSLPPPSAELASAADLGTGGNWPAQGASSKHHKQHHKKLHRKRHPKVRANSRRANGR